MIWQCVFGWFVLRQKKSRTLRPLDNASLGQCVPWVMRPMDVIVPWTLRPWPMCPAVPERHRGTLSRVLHFGLSIGGLHYVRWPKASGHLTWLTYLYSYRCKVCPAAPLQAIPNLNRHKVRVSQCSRTHWSGTHRVRDASVQEMEHPRLFVRGHTGLGWGNSEPFYRSHLCSGDLEIVCI